MLTPYWLSADDVHIMNTHVLQACYVFIYNDCLTIQIVHRHSLYKKKYMYVTMCDRSYFLCLRSVRVPEALCFRVVRPSVRTGISLPRNFKNPWVNFNHTWLRGAPWGVDELIRFWARSARGQRSKVNELGLNMIILPRYREISRTPWWIFIKLGTRVHHDMRSKWTD